MSKMQLDVFRRWTLIGLVGLVAACGNDREGLQMSTSMMGAAKRATGAANVQAPALDPNDVVPMVLSTFKGPTMIVEIEKENLKTVLNLAATNLEHETYFAPDRTAVHFQRGLVSGTRGLSGDLMAAEIGGSVALVTGRKAGATTRVHYHLDGDNNEIGTSYTCTINPQGSTRVTLGEVNQSGRTVSESCQGEGIAFENSYVVGNDGRVLQSRQWIGPSRGYAIFKVVRF